MSMTEVSLESYYDRLRQHRVGALQSRIDTINNQLATFGPEKVALNLKELLETCLLLDQTEPVYGTQDYIKVRKVCQIHIKSSQKSIEACYGSRVMKIPYYGLFVVIEGILTSHYFKIASGYDEWESEVQKMLVPIPVPSANSINFAAIPEGYRTDLVSPAVDGLFFPKASPFVDLFRRHQLVFFDVNDY